MVVIAGRVMVRKRRSTEDQFGSSRALRMS